MVKAAEAAEQAAETGRENKRIALLIAALALALALTEVAGDDARTEAQMKNVEAANLWAFFQAKTIRQTVVAVEADRAVIDAAQTVDLATRAALEQQAQRWRANVARWETEPETGEGRRELMTRARGAEAARDQAIRDDGRYDLAATGIQIGIVLASAAIITAAPALIWAGALLGAAGAVLTVLTFMGF